jgi:hypothetical protein
VTSTVGADTNTIGPHWRVDSIEVGEGREGRDGRRKTKDEEPLAEFINEASWGEGRVY